MKNAVLIAILVALIVLTGCGGGGGGGGTSVPPVAMGKILVRVPATLSATATRSSVVDTVSVSVLITGSGISAAIKGALTKNATTWEGTFNVPAGLARGIVVEGKDASGNTVFLRSRTSDIMAGQTTTLTINLYDQSMGLLVVRVPFPFIFTATSFTAEISGSEISPSIVGDLTKSTDAWIGNFDIPAGTDRLVVVTARDVSHNVIASLNQTTAVIAGQTTTLNFDFGNNSPVWLVTNNGEILQIAYGVPGDYPQYGALHTDSGYFRLVYAKDAGWGTSVIVLPSLWTGGRYFQGAPISVQQHIVGNNLVIDYSGSIVGLGVQGEIILSPPTGNSITADITISTTGTVTLDSNRPGESFKPVMLSSMHVSPTQWDAQSAFSGVGTHPIPGSGWIIQPVDTSNIFGLTGGTSSWKTNAPTVEITLDQPMEITGWVTGSANPNDDNIGFWCATDHQILSWHYKIVAKL